MTAVMAPTADALALPGGADEPDRPTPSATAHSRKPGRRALSYLLTVGLLVCLNFALPRTLPGDPITAMTATAAASGVAAEADDASSRARLERYYGLDRPLVSQFGSYLSDLAQGDLGTSIKHRVPVRALLADRMPWSLLLMATSITLATVAGMVGGIHSGWRAGRARAGCSTSSWPCARCPRSSWPPPCC
jgi:ABC-type dipeptide/oligopeptide/nickel transport system permease component